MITAARLQRCTSRDDVFALLRELGYDVAPVAIVSAEWRRAGIEIGWSDALALDLAARTPQLDLYVISGGELPDAGAITAFLRSLTSYNALVKPVVVGVAPSRLTIHDLSSRREARRLDIDLDHPSAHALDRLNLLAAGSDPARIFNRALDRESLTRQFFERFRRAVREVSQAIGAALPREPNDGADGHALLLLSRLLFLYFIQQKGWLNDERRFLVDRIEAAVRDGRGVYATLFRPLFFGCLNTAVRERDATARGSGNIPYLNGGLFEPSAFEERNAGLDLPDELLQRVVEEVFETFAFSIDESDAAGTHIDPEMLGKVFESLMANEERLSTGSFYTPRAIVDVLAARAIVAWLSDGDAATQDVLNAIVREEPVRRPRNARALAQRLETIAILDPACGSGAFLLSALRIVERLTAALDVESQPDLRRRIVERSLYGVDLKPEAVRLCELRLWLAIVSQTDASIDSIQPLPNLDRNILQGNSLLSPTDFLGDNRGDVYREWVYALRAQSDLIARYRNAPHRERAAVARLIRANDGRLAAELVAKAIDLDEREQEQLCAPQRDLFGRMRALNLERCRELYERIGTNRRMLERIEEGEIGFFSFDVHFAHVMARGGFDVVIGNPPWVRNSRIDPRVKRMYAERFPLFRGDGKRGASAFHQPDLSIAFVERALSLATPGGVVSLLVPAKLLNAGYAAPLRRHAAASVNMVNIVALDDWSSDAQRHFDADTFPLGMTLRVCATKHVQARIVAEPWAIDAGGRAALARRNGGPAPPCISVTSAGQSFTLPHAALTLHGSEWSLLPPDVHAIVARIHASHAPLADTLGRAPVMGVKTGDNSSFFLDVRHVRANAVETTDGIQIPFTAVCRCVRGRDVRRWKVAEPPWMLWPPAGGWPKPPRWVERFAEARGVEVDSLRLSYVRPEHVGIKVVWKDLSRGLCAAVLEDSMRLGDRAIPLVPNQTLYALDAASIDEAYVFAALLNSTIVNVLAVAIAERAKDSYFRYFGRTIARLPLPLVPPSSASWTRLLRAARRAASSPAASSTEAIDDIDRTVAALYGVPLHEHEQLASFLRKRLGMAGDA
ncbi:MAG: N-6 DNA methylase [Acidobacteriota bacterium]|nr:N-6 DNA methylase [Acidobacteriota bacterium]